MNADTGLDTSPVLKETLSETTGPEGSAYTDYEKTHPDYDLTRLPIGLGQVIGHLEALAPLEDPRFSIHSITGMSKAVHSNVTSVPERVDPGAGKVMAGTFSNVKLITPEFSRMFIMDLFVKLPFQPSELGVVVSVNSVTLYSPGKGVPELLIEP